MSRSLPSSISSIKAHGAQARGPRSDGGPEMPISSCNLQLKLHSIFIHVIFDFLEVFQTLEYLKFKVLCVQGPLLFCLRFLPLCLRVPTLCAQGPTGLHVPEGPCIN
ncbi:hypothetical protein EVAR_86369_1 [Eumeta japonica]|uniref:Uncharacterized protein n=1 Tax=Eumeta variegata TaxID=151549 RepID=A0A4C1YGU0_EUMVA|nr:hypothetical protein EVAR_86369_1 [Eumeta japonica]